MSKITLAPNASGTGTLTVAAPNTNTDYTLTLPTATGTLVYANASGNVIATGNIVSQSGSNAYLGIVGGGGTTYSPYVGVFNGSGTRIGYSSYWTGTEYILGLADGATPMTFWANGSERMRIDASGSLLMGTTSFTYGYTGDAVQITKNGGYIIISHTTTAAANCLAFNNANGQVGSVNTSGSTTTYSTSSDYRLKENVQPMTGALDTIAQLNPVTYNWKVDGSDGQGFIAHELQAVVPDCVSGEKDAVDDEGRPRYQGVDTSFLVATLVKAIQEQQQMIQALQADIAALKGV